MLLLLRTNNMWIYVMSRVRPAGRPAVMRGKQFHVGHYTQTVRCLHTCHAYGYHCLPPFHITFTDLDFARGSQGQRKSKPLAFVCSDIFLLISMQVGFFFFYGIDQFKLNISVHKGNNCCFTDWVEKTNYRWLALGRL